MNKTVLCAALVGLMTTAAVGSVHAADMTGKEKCFGIAKAGKNDCKSVAGAHSCAGQSTKDNDPTEFKIVDSGSCASSGGSLTPGAAK